MHKWKIPLTVEANGMPVRIPVMWCTITDCRPACGFKADYAMADKGYDSVVLVSHIEDADMETVIPPRKHRKEQGGYDTYLYSLRQLVENAFMELKKWRIITTRYTNNTSSFLAAVHIRCMAIWAKGNCK